MEYIKVYEINPTGFVWSYVLWVFVWYNVRLVVIVVCCDYRSVQIVFHVGDDRLIGFLGIYTRKRHSKRVTQGVIL